MPTEQREQNTEIRQCEASTERKAQEVISQGIDAQCNKHSLLVILNFWSLSHSSDWHHSVCLHFVEPSAGTHVHVHILTNALKSMWNWGVHVMSETV